MDQVAEWSCTICGEKMPAGRKSFAVTQSRIEDRVRVFHREDLAGPDGVHGACCSAHVRDLVIHWMVTGNLDHPFADSGSRRKPAMPYPARSLNCEKVFASRAAPIGELAIDRDSVSRILLQTPARLNVILEELHDALEQSIESRPTGTVLEDLPEASSTIRRRRLQQLRHSLLTGA